MLLVRTPRVEVEARCDTVTRRYQIWASNLANGGESVQLDDADGGSIHDFTFDDNGPTWHPTTNGEGFSLVILAPLGNLNDWGQGAKWRPSFERNGSPGERDQMLGDFDVDDDVDLLDLAYLQSRLDVSGPATRSTGDLTQNGIINREDAARFVLNFSPSYQPLAMAPGSTVSRSPTERVAASPAATRLQTTRRGARTSAATDEAISSVDLLAPDTARTTLLLARRLRVRATVKPRPGSI